MKIAVAAAMTTLLTLGAAQAADPVVPQTGSEQDITVPHATPGSPVHQHSAKDEGHIIAPSGDQATSSEGGVTPANSVPGSRARTGASQPHADVTAPRGVVPETGSAQGPNTR